MKVRIENSKVKYNLPSTYKDISISQGLIISSLRERKNIDIKLKTKILCRLMHCNYNVLKQVNEKEIELLYDILYYLKDAIPIKLAKIFHCNNNIYSLIDFNKLNVLQWMDLDYHLQNLNSRFNEHESILNLLGILLKPLKLNIFQKLIKYTLNIVTNLFNIKKIIPLNFIKNVETKDYNEEQEDKYISKVKDIFNKYFNYYDAIYLIKLFTDFKKQEYINFNLIEEDEEEVKHFDEIEEEEDYNDYDEGFQSIWGYYDVIQNLTEGKLTELNLWKDRNFRELLKRMCYQSEKNRMERELQRKREQEYKSKYNL